MTSDLTDWFKDENAGNRMRSGLRDRATMSDESGRDQPFIDDATYSSLYQPSSHQTEADFLIRKVNYDGRAA